MAEFKDRLETALKMRGLKAADLARLTGIGEGAISQYRKGSYKATQRNLDAISTVLEVSIPWLMGVSDEISADKEAISALISPADQALLDAYHRADPADRTAVDAILSKYAAPQAALKNA